MGGQGLKKIAAAFYRTSGGAEPVRDWLKALSSEDRREIARTSPPSSTRGLWGLWEVRSNLSGNRIARVIFCISQGRMVLLHGFVKKTQKFRTRTWSWPADA